MILKRHWKQLLFGLCLCMLTGCARPADAAVLKPGTQGTAVTNLQQALTLYGYDVRVDGIYGSATTAAVRQLQQDFGLKTDGIAGPSTAQALKVSSETFAPLDNPQDSSYTVWMRATGYCPCNQCNYPYGGQPAYLGHPLQKGIAAVDPSVIPMGSSLYIPGYGEAVAADQGNAIVGNRIDLCFATHEEALNWGIKTVPVTVYP